MPVSSDPDQTVPFWLPGDAHKPMAERPIFICRAMTFREQRKIAEIADRGVKERDHAKCFQIVVEALRIGIVGWERMPRPGHCIPFDLNEIDTILNNEEIWELVHNYPYAASLTEIDAPKSRPQSPSPGMGSAATAPQANANSPLQSLSR